MKINPTPCYNCITLAICKNRVRDYIGEFHPDHEYNGVKHLCIFCPELSIYVRPYSNYIYSIYHRRLAMHYLTGTDMKGDQQGYTYGNIDDLYHIAHMDNPHNQT